ncbi:MAG TPA: acylglycerol kinase family protein, partial [Actinomycetota bacterium]|nr:acylglycerol kinase family protein [Actinomycetota bacterium]
MSNPFGRLVLIADPSEPTEQGSNTLAVIERKLRSMGLDYRVVSDGSSGERERAAREALLAGDRFVVAVGGDGIIHEVANGMLRDGRPVDPEAVLGVIPAGAPCDFVKTFGLPSDIERACGHLAGDRVFPIDAGALVATRDGADVTRSFVNIAEVGMGASMVRRQGRFPERLGRGRRFLGFWLSLATFRPTRVRLT